MRRRAVRLQIVAVGRLRPPFQALGELYATRIAQRIPLRVDEVAHEPLRRDEKGVRRREAARLRERLLPGARRVALDLSGRVPASSEAFAEWLRQRIEAPSPLALILGGASGLERALVEESEERLSLGPLTLPHELARVVLLEQLYRGSCIIAGHPYHH